MDIEKLYDWYVNLYTGLILIMSLKTLFNIAQPVLNFRSHNPKDRQLLHSLPGKPWKTVGADIFMLNNNHSCVL